MGQSFDSFPVITVYRNLYNNPYTIIYCIENGLKYTYIFYWLFVLFTVAILSWWWWRRRRIFGDLIRCNHLSGPTKQISYVGDLHDNHQWCHFLACSLGLRSLIPRPLPHFSLQLWRKNNQFFSMARTKFGSGLGTRLHWGCSFESTENMKVGLFQSMAVRVILTIKLISYCAFSQWKTPLMANSLQHYILTLNLYLSGSISEPARIALAALQSNPTVVLFQASPHCKQQKGLGRKLSDKNHSCLPCNSVQCISQPLFQPQVQSIIGAHKRMK